MHPTRDRPRGIQPFGNRPPSLERNRRADRATPRTNARTGVAPLVSRARDPGHSEVDASRPDRRERPALRLHPDGRRRRAARPARSHRRHRHRSRAQVVARVATRISLRAAIDEVASRDPFLAELVAQVGPIRQRPRDPDGPFAALVRAIVFQQLAGRAAQAIYGRVRAAVGDSLTPEAVDAASDAALRSARLSANKLAALRDLSAKVLPATVVLSPRSRRS